jgi:hypothetical protein
LTFGPVARPSHVFRGVPDGRPQFHTLGVATAEARTDSVEALERVLSYLVTERQRLRAGGADKSELEANRLAIVSIQSHLGQALGARHAGPAA